KIMRMGPQTLVIKRGEYGAILFHGGQHFIVPGFLLEDVFDPTGAGDCFAGGFMGYLAQQGVQPQNAEIEQQVPRRAAMRESRTPGCPQFGTVWLPMLHALLLPVVARDELWRSGLAGVIPPAICFVLGVTFLFAAVRRVFSSTAAGATAAALYAMNPNALYLQSTPMTEAIFFASLVALLY